MVTINFTLLVLLVMFLGFLWVMHRFVFKPVLALLDARDEQIAADKRIAAEAGAEAGDLEDQYMRKIARMHHEASLHLVRAHRQAQEEHNGRVVAFKAKAEQEIRALHQSLSADIARQEELIVPLTQDVCKAMAVKLELE